MVISQDINGGYEIQLTGHNLPFRPVKDSKAERIVKTWYPGADTASVQVLGHDYQEMELTGLWDEVFTPATKLIVEGQVVQNPMPNDLNQAMAAMMENGKPVDISWEAIDGTGYITAWEVEYETTTRMSWRLVLSRISVDFGQVDISLKKPPRPKSLLDNIQGAIDTINNAMDDMSDLERQYVTGPLAKLNSMLNQVSDLVHRAMDFATEPAKIARSAITTLENVKQDALDIVDDARALTGQYRRVTESFGHLSRPIAWEYHGGSDRGPESAETETKTAALKRQVSSIATGIAAEAVILQTQYAAQVHSTAIAVHIVRQNETLQSIAWRYYRNRDRWTDIADMNGLDSGLLETGTVLLIPEVM